MNFSHLLLHKNKVYCSLVARFTINIVSKCFTEAKGESVKVTGLRLNFFWPKTRKTPLCRLLLSQFLADLSWMNHVRFHPGGDLHQTLSAEEEDLPAELQGEAVRPHPGENRLLWFWCWETGTSDLQPEWRVTSELNIFLRSPDSCDIC